MWCVCVHVHTCTGATAQCGRQRTTSLFSPSTMWLLKVKFKSPAWLQAPLPTKKSHWPISTIYPLSHLEFTVPFSMNTFLLSNTYLFPLTVSQNCY